MSGKSAIGLSERTPRKCLVNLAHLDPASNGGASRVAREVALALVTTDPSILRTTFIVRGRFFSRFRHWLATNRSVAVIPYSRWFSPQLMLRILKPDIMVSPLFGVSPFMSTGKIPHIVSLPDTLALDHPELFSELEVRSRQETYRRACSAQQVVTLSEYMASKLRQHLPDLENRIRVIMLGADSLPDAPEASLVAGRYVFYPANSWLHKRHELLLKTMRLIWQAEPQVKLVLSGGRPPNVDLTALIAQHAPAGNVIDLGYVTDKELSALYQHAEAVLFASEYEGFGMPVLEAMRAGCPVICAPLTALPEVAGDAALYVADDTPQGWADAYLVQLPQRRAEFIRRGRQRAAQFTWTQTRSQWLELILKAANASFADG